MPAILLSLALALTACRSVTAAPRAASPVLSTITIGLEAAGLVEDPSIGHALVFTTWDPSAMVIDVRRRTILRTLTLGSKYDFVWSDVDPHHHRFVFNLPRGADSQGGGNAVYLLDSRGGAVLRVLQGLRTPGWLAVLDSRTGRVLRQLPAGYNVTDMQMDRQVGLLLLESRGTNVQPGTLAILDLRQL